MAILMLIGNKDEKKKGGKTNLNKKHYYGDWGHDYGHGHGHGYGFGHGYGYGNGLLGGIPWGYGHGFPYGGFGR